MTTKLKRLAESILALDSAEPVSPAGLQGLQLLANEALLEASMMKELCAMPSGEVAALIGDTVIEGRKVSEWRFAGYFLCNYQPGRISLHRPNGGGHHLYIEGDIADGLGKVYDPHNYAVWQQRVAAPTGAKP